VLRLSGPWIGTYADFGFWGCVRWLIYIIDGNRLGTVPFIVVIADTTGVGLFAFLA